MKKTVTRCHRGVVPPTYNQFQWHTIMGALSPKLASFSNKSSVGKFVLVWCEYGATCADDTLRKHDMT